MFFLDVSHDFYFGVILIEAFAAGVTWLLMFSDVHDQIIDRVEEAGTVGSATFEDDAGVHISGHRALAVDLVTGRIGEALFASRTLLRLVLGDQIVLSRCHFRSPATGLRAGRGSGWIRAPD